MKTGFIAMVGMPNAGKSTLVNRIIGEKVGIISKKPQTTRKRVVGIYSDADSQICFIDSPGHVKEGVGLNAFLQTELAAVIRESDACLAVLNLDAYKMSDLLEIVEMVKNSKRKWAIVINKLDLDHTGQREAKLRMSLLDSGVEIVSCSGLKGTENIREKLLPIIKNLLPESEQPLFSNEIYTTQSTKELVAEIVREKCFEYLHQEVPYGLAVKVLKYDESHPTHRIFVDIIVSKENFVPMVVGQGGQMIKRIGASSRIDCEKTLGRKIYLETRVKVKKDWTKNSEVLKELGYVTAE